jgi:hypothetical protein
MFGSRPERVIELKLRPPVLVIAHQRYRLSDHRDNRALVFAGQSVQQPGWDCDENDRLTSLRSL